MSGQFAKFTPMERMVKARIQLLMHQPFFGTLAMRLKLIEVPKGPLNPYGTMATDGRMISFSPDFLAKITDKEIEGVIAHEVMHVALKHHLRRRTRQPKKWNVACDATINCDLIEAGFQLPKPRVDMPEHKGKAAETIYNELPDNEGGGDGGGDEWGVVLDDPQAGGSEGEQAEAENEVNIMVAQAAQAQEKHEKAKGRGALPAWMKRLVEQALEPEVKWEDVMRRFVVQRVPYDHTWSRINRRFAHSRLYLPGLLKDGLGEVVALFDTSGSMTQKMLTRIYSECNALFVDCRPEKLHAMACDASVGNFVTFEDEPHLAMDMFVGGGGSDFRPAFAKIDELGIKPVCCLVFSDMDICFPVQPPGYPVLCISTTDRRGPDWATEHVQVKDC